MMTHCAFAGRRVLGSLPDPLVRVDSLATLAAQIDAQNTRIIRSELVEADGPQQEEEDPSEVRRWVWRPGHGRAPGRPSEMNEDAAGRHASSNGEGVDIGKPDATSAKECPSEAAPSSTAGQQQAGKRKRSRLGTLISRLRRKKPLQAATHQKDTATSTEAAPEAQSMDHSSPQPVQHSSSPSDEPLTQAVPRQEHGLFSQPDETRAPETAASSHGVSRVAVESEDINADSMAQSAAGAESSAKEESETFWSVYVDWAEMNKSMMDSTHKLVSTMTAAFILQVIMSDAPSSCASLVHNYALLSGCAWRLTRNMMQWLHNIVSSLTKGLMAQVSLPDAPVAAVHQRSRPRLQQCVLQKCILIASSYRRCHSSRGYVLL